CLGNICRSPLAEGILKDKAQAAGLDWWVDSAGTGAYHVGETPDPRSIAVARNHGIDILDQRARQFTTLDLDQFDRIYAMDQSNFHHIKRQAKTADQLEKVQLIMNMVHPGANQDVPDPYWDNNGFEKVYRMLDQACDKIIQEFK
ncbi:MAG: low molecular weight phosphotyrosine protein phosphatase, partial [Phaeodactylibacter sp.]|nr:low molecular weight phosphotyrosine protein phosphatase [Phaeodactylibacter sp.]